MQLQYFGLKMEPQPGELETQAVELPICISVSLTGRSPPKSQMEAAQTGYQGRFCRRQGEPQTNKHMVKELGASALGSQCIFRKDIMHV